MSAVLKPALERASRSQSSIMGEWISVFDSTPNQPGHYVCRFSDGIIEVFYFSQSEMNVFDVLADYNPMITHWLLLPDLTMRLI